MFNVFIHVKIRIFSIGERWNDSLSKANHENILTTALINIHYLLTMSDEMHSC